MLELLLHAMTRLFDLCIDKFEVFSHFLTMAEVDLLGICKTAKTVDARTMDLSLSFTSLLNKQEKRERETNVIDN